MRRSYKNSGVDVEAGYKAVALMKKHVIATFNENVLTGLGGFGGLFSLGCGLNMEEPVLCASTDGVGTKLKIAFLLDKHDTIGIDCVAMCVNDIVCTGAKPLFFLDYIACGKNKPERIEEIVKGVANGCKQAGCALIGGETAEMPGFYADDEYDIAGFCVGIVDKKDIIDGRSIKKGDAIIGIASSGLHSNGYSLVRAVLRPNSEKMAEYIKSLNNRMGDTLITPTKIYVDSILSLRNEITVKGIANITGGGFNENIPRILPEGLSAKINKNSWTIPAIFDIIGDIGKIDENEMYAAFNMGIGMVAVVPSEDAQNAVNSLEKSGETAYIIGEVDEGSGVELCSN